MFSRWQIRVLLSATVLFGVGIGLLMAAIPNQGRTQFFGSSGGNVNNIGKSFCCSGTLGSLVKNSSGVEYILSNNHVLADTDQAAPGQNISQPWLTITAVPPPPWLTSRSHLIWEPTWTRLSLN